MKCSANAVEIAKIRSEKHQEIVDAQKCVVEMQKETSQRKIAFGAKVAKTVEEEGEKIVKAQVALVEKLKNEVKELDIKQVAQEQSRQLALQKIKVVEEDAQLLYEEEEFLDALPYDEREAAAAELVKDGENNGEDDVYADDEDRKHFDDAK